MKSNKEPSIIYIGTQIMPSKLLEHKSSITSVNSYGVRQRRRETLVHRHFVSYIFYSSYYESRAYCYEWNSYSDRILLHLRIATKSSFSQSADFLNKTALIQNLKHNPQKNNHTLTFTNNTSTQNKSLNLIHRPSTSIHT